MRQTLIFTLIGATVFCLLSHNELFAEEGDTNIIERIFKDENGSTMPYRFYKPANYDAKKKYPLVLCLHGAGGRGTDNKSKGIQAFQPLTNEKWQKKYPAFVVTPQCPKNKKWVNADWTKGSYDSDKIEKSEQLKLVMKILDTLRKEFSIDETRIYVTGQSMGGYGTWDIIIRHPKLFAAAIPVCGGGDPSKAESIKHLPIWTFHGDKDEVVPVKGTREMVAALKKVKGKIIYTELKGTTHNAWTPAWANKKLIPWLFKQKK